MGLTRAKIAVASLAAGLATVPGTAFVVSAQTSIVRTPARLARGRYIVEGPAQCFDCHSELRTNTRPIEVVPGRKGAGRINPMKSEIPV